MSTYKLSDTILRRVYPLVKDNAKLRAEGITKDRLRTIIRDNRAVKLARGQYISAHNWQNLNITESILPVSSRIHGCWMNLYLHIRVQPYCTVSLC